MVYGCFSLLLASIALISVKTYCPFNCSSQLEDFHFADTISNLFAVPAILCMGYAVTKGPSHNHLIKDVVGVVGGLVLYEVLLSFSIGMTLLLL